VSAENLQAKEGTIESQVLALKKQIAAAGHVLVKEYIDNGFSGPRFDRPALNEMRKDVKNDVFDVIYFHDADRIAREVTIQNIIVEEILKYQARSIKRPSSSPPRKCLWLQAFLSPLTFVHVLCYTSNWAMPNRAMLEGALAIQACGRCPSER